MNQVAPYTGAWIEILRECFIMVATLVAPYTGAWIEILPAQILQHNDSRRSLHGSVD